jgi:pilus assembly protein FimV
VATTVEELPAGFWDDEDGAPGADHPAGRSDAPAGPGPAAEPAARSTAAPGSAPAPAPAAFGASARGPRTARRDAPSGASPAAAPPALASLQGLALLQAVFPGRVIKVERAAAGDDEATADPPTVADSVDPHDDDLEAGDEAPPAPTP